MSNQNTLFPYLHGFSQEEQDRLRAQARFGEFSVYKNIDFSNCSNLLEVGCGVGAQTEILLRRFPDLQITGIDFSDVQLSQAQQNIDQLDINFKKRVNFKQMDATQMDFDSNIYEGAFLCWILEHVKEPAKVLNECRRVLKLGAKVFITEVMNSTFFLDPYSPNLWKYWMAFNDYQYDGAGDPFVGAKLGNLLSSVGFQKVETNVITWHLDNRSPGKRKEVIEYWSELLFSAKEQLIETNYTTLEIADKAFEEIKSVKNDPNGVFYYSFMQASAQKL